MNQLDNENFFETIKSSNKCVVDFFAEWCGPCKAMHPILEGAEKEMGEGRIFKVNIEENPELAEKLEIRSIPTFIFYENGKEISRKSGMVSKNFLIESLS
jgi:thioredoxin 1